MPISSKVDTNGNTVLCDPVGGPLNDGARAVAIDSAGSLFYVAGGTPWCSFPHR